MSNIRSVALPKDLKKQNSHEIMRIICAEKIFTIAHITEVTRISRQTVTKAVENFIEKGIVVEGELGTSTNLGGRKPKEYQLNPNKYIIVASILDKMILFNLRNIQGKEIDRIKVYRHIPEYEEYLRIVETTINTFISKWEINHFDVIGIMLCIGGVIDEKQGLACNSKNWDETVELRKDVSQLFDQKIPVNIGNVSTVSARSLMGNKEMLGKKVIVVYIDNGIGITCIEDGRMKSTKHGITGELGHMILNFKSEQSCHMNDKGCFESLVYENNFTKWIDKLPEDRRQNLLETYDSEEDLREYLVLKSKQGNRDASEMVEYMADVFAAAFQNLEFAFDPDLFLIEGTFVNWTDEFKKCIISKIKRNQYLKNIEIKIEMAQASLEDMLVEGSIGVILQELIKGGEQNENSIS